MSDEFQRLFSACFHENGPFLQLSAETERLEFNFPETFNERLSI